MSAASLIAEAIEVWETGTDGERNAMASLLDWFNNGDAVPYIPLSPPPPIY